MCYCFSFLLKRTTFIFKHFRLYIEVSVFQFSVCILAKKKKQFVCIAQPMSRTALSAMHPSYCHVALFHSLLHCRTECWWLFHFSCALVLISPDIDMLPPCATCQVKEMSSWNSDTCSTKGLIFLNRNRFNVKNIIRSINQFLVFFFHFSHFVYFFINVRS